jgi:F-type H+-transporting ATPase subunit b
MDWIVARLQDNHFWVGVAFTLLVMLLVRLGVPGMAAKALDSRAKAIQDQLDEARKIREEATALLADIQAQKVESDKMATEMLATAKAEAKRLEKDAGEKLAEQIKRRGEMAERKIASAEAQATAEVKAAAADLAASLAENVLAARIKGAKTDPLIDTAVKGLAGKLQ